MNTKDPTLNMNLLLEQIEGSVDVSEKNARHMNDREIAAGMARVQKRFLKLMRKEIQPSESSIRVLKDIDEDEDME